MSEQKNYDLPKEDTKALDTLFSNIGLIEQNKSLIYETADYYNICIFGVGVCLSHMEKVPLFLVLMGRVNQVFYVLLIFFLQTLLIRLLIEKN